MVTFLFFPAALLRQRTSPSTFRTLSGKSGLLSTFLFDLTAHISMHTHTHTHTHLQPETHFQQHVSQTFKKKKKKKSGFKLLQKKRENVCFLYCLKKKTFGLASVYEINDWQLEEMMSFIFRSMYLCVLFLEGRLCLTSTIFPVLLFSTQLNLTGQL